MVADTSVLVIRRWFPTVDVALDVLVSQLPIGIERHEIHLWDTNDAHQSACKTSSEYMAVRGKGELRKG
jgi:hypothetical protein